jgi:hypothetical protein
MFEFKWRYRDAVKNNLGLKGSFFMILDLNFVVINMIATGVYMVVNFKVCRISRCTRKLARTPEKKKLKI